MLVDHVLELEPPAVRGGVELEVHSAYLVGMFRPMTPYRAFGGPCPSPLPGSGPQQASLPPEPFHWLVVHRPAFPPKEAVGHLDAPANVVSRDPPQAMPQLDHLQVDHLAPMAMGAAVLAHHTAGQHLRNPVACAQDLNSLATPFRAQKLPSARSLSIAFSSSILARSLLSRAFSFSS